MFFYKLRLIHIFIRILFHGPVCLTEVVDISDKSPPEPPQANIFDQIDLDSDGSLSKSEIDAYFVQMGSTTPDGLWEKEDTDGDGIISWEEFSGPKGDSPTSEEL